MSTKYADSYNRYLKKYLIKNSFLLFVIYMLSGILLVSINDNSSWDIILIRTITTGVFTYMVFFVNANIIIYFRNKKNQFKSNKQIENRIFITGYLMTILIMGINRLFSYILMQNGVNLHMPDTFEDANTSTLILLMLFISLVQYTFIYLIQNFTLSQYDKNRIELQLLQLKSSNAETTNLLLKQQIQPHFLFNALNTLKSLIHKDPEVAEDYLIKLSDFLRASFSNNSSGLASVEDELSICQNYMDMQQIRFNEALLYEVDSEVMRLNNTYKLPVFSVQPLLENAIKHNIATATQPLKIQIHLIGEHIVVTNNIQPKKYIEDSTKSGLKNLNERYKIISGEEIHVAKDDQFFSVSIKMLQS